MRLKPISERRLDYQGRAQLNLSLHAEVLDLVQKTQQESGFRGSQTQFIELLLKRGVEGLRDDRAAATNDATKKESSKSSR